MRKATGLDWAGDPIQVEGRFQPRHGERTYEQMVAHFKDYNDIVGDHPLNLCATSLAANAYFLTHEAKYKTWLLEYVDAWVERMKANGDIIPTNIGLDGTIGGACGGRWYGGVYGWGFSVEVPQTGATGPSQQHTTWTGRLWQCAIAHRRSAVCRRLAAADRRRQRARQDDRRPHDVPPHARR